MDSDLIRQGSRYTITGDVHVPEGVAFRRGDEVIVEKIIAYPERSDHRYVVKSGLLDKTFLLSASNLASPGWSASSGNLTKNAHGDLNEVNNGNPESADTTTLDKLKGEEWLRESKRLRNKNLKLLLFILPALGLVVLFMLLDMLVIAFVIMLLTAIPAMPMAYKISASARQLSKTRPPMPP